ncbi:AAA family ATPase [Agromyces sp. NPDC058064]|uniref:AAA family ATPase n=1 Tax=Agromyces sp. NPDC058064 TaxID=3346322 RepID=UPI0036D8EC8B
MPDSPTRPRRILVTGTSGSGKTTLGRRIAVAAGLPFQEIDALFHGPDWTPRPSFVEDVDRFTAQDAWVIEWQYDTVRPMLAERAQLLVFLDYSRWRVMRQVTRRTVSRRVRREELWNGNIEPSLATVLTDHEHIVRWAWRTHALWPSRVAEVSRTHPGLEVVRLGRPRDADAWLRQAFPSEA